MSRKLKRIGTALRGDVAEAYDARGNSRADLILHYSPLMQRDVVLTGLLQYYHFLMVERDALVTAVDYSPYERLAKLAGEHYARLVSAEVTKSDGSIVWRRLVREEPDTAKFTDELKAAIGKGPLQKITAFEIYSLPQLVAQPMLTRNSHRAISWIAAARDWPLAGYKTEVLDLLKNSHYRTFKECLDLGSEGNQALFGAATLHMALRGSIASNLDIEPLTENSRFSLVKKRG